MVHVQTFFSALSGTPWYYRHLGAAILGRVPTSLISSDDESIGPEKGKTVHINMALHGLPCLDSVYL